MRNFRNLFIIILLILLIFIVFIWDRNYYVGGDIMLPINPKNNFLRFFYLWEERNGGQYFFKYMSLVWQSIFYFFYLLKIPADIGIKIYIILNYLISIIFTYFSYQELFRNTKYNNSHLAIFSALFFLFNPASLLVLVGFHGLYFFPVCFFLYLKYLKSGKYFYLIPFALIYNFAFFSDLPQAKNITVFSLSIFLSSLIYLKSNSDSLNNSIKKYLLSIVIVFLLNAFSLLPFIDNSFFNGHVFHDYSKAVTVYDGNADLHSASLLYTPRFFNSNLIGDSNMGKFLQNPLFIIWSYLLWFIILINLILEKEKPNKYLLFSLLGICIFFFLAAKGSNPPFGQIYKYLVLNIPVFKIFRTTSTMVIAAVLPYVFLLTLSVAGIIKKNLKLFYLLIIFNALFFYPVYMFLKTENIYEGKVQKGTPIPKVYLETSEYLDNLKDDSQIISLPLDEGYVYKDWNYMGVSLMSYLTKKPFIHAYLSEKNQSVDNLFLRNMSQEGLCLWLKLRNIGYVLEEKDSLTKYQLDNLFPASNRILDNGYFVLRKLSLKCYLPHIYKTENIYLYDGSPNKVSFFPEIRNNAKPIAFVNKNKDFNFDKLSGIILEGESPLINIIKNKTGKIDFNPFEVSFKYDFNIENSDEYILRIENSETISAISQKKIKLIPEKSYLFTKGKQEVKLNLKNSLNLLSDSWLNSEINGGYSKLEPPSNPDLKKPVIFRNINNWKKGKIYLLHLAFSAPKNYRLSLIIDETKNIYPGRKPIQKINISPLVINILAKGGQEEQYFLVKSDQDSLSSRIYLGNITDKLNLNKIEIKEILIPSIFLFKKSSPIINKTQIYYKKINPTKYIISISADNFPQLLVFSETFNSGWKLSPVNRSDNEGNNLISIKHVLVNDYANGYFIKSNNSSKKNIELILEFFPQKIFRFGVIIAVITGLFCIFMRFKQYFSK